MSRPHDSPWEMVTEASLAYADASEDPQDFARAKDRLRKAALRYGLAAALGRDREVVVVVRYRKPKPTPPGQWALWPARTSH